MSPKAIPHKATPPDFPFFFFFVFSRVYRPYVLHFPVLGCIFAVVPVLSIPGADPHGPHILWIEH